MDAGKAICGKLSLNQKALNKFQKKKNGDSSFILDDC
jgi:hypothetical protein